MWVGYYILKVIHIKVFPRCCYILWPDIHAGAGKINLLALFEKTLYVDIWPFELKFGYLF